MPAKCEKCRRALLPEESGVYCGDCLDDIQSPRRGMDSIADALQAAQARISDITAEVERLRDNLETCKTELRFILDSDSDSHEMSETVWRHLELIASLITPTEGGK